MHDPSMSRKETRSDDVSDPVVTGDELGGEDVLLEPEQFLWRQLSVSESK